MATVRQILKTKGYRVCSVRPDDSILDALHVMAENEIGAVLVMQDEDILGIFSERDYARRGILKGNPPETPVSKLMTSLIYYVSPAQTLEECMAQMTDKHIRHLPVLENGKVIGVISIGDVVKTMLSDQQNLIQGLESYIVGREYHL
ncbi:MAG TPA: CBS domain-containing protein [Anaerolineaceae bacterium]|jgi:CBS domain-containing protein